MASTADLWNTIPSLTTETVQFDPFNLFESWQISSQLKGQHSHISSSRAVLKTSAQQSTAYSTWHGTSVALDLIKNVPGIHTHEKAYGLAVVLQTTAFRSVRNQCTLWFNCATKVPLHTYNEILLSHKKEWIWVSSTEVDEPRACFTEWSKSEREKTDIIY